MKPTLEQIEKVAEWWAVRTFDKALNQNNGDDSENGAMAFILMNMNASNARQSASSDSRESFKRSIIDLLDKGEMGYTLDVDYSPNEPLRVACNSSGINSGMLPCKTFSLWHSSDCKFRGRHMYGGPWEDIA